MEGENAGSVGGCEARLVQSGFLRLARLRRDFLLFSVSQPPSMLSHPCQPRALSGLSDRTKKDKSDADVLAA